LLTACHPDELRTASDPVISTWLAHATDKAKLPEDCGPHRAAQDRRPGCRGRMPAWRVSQQRPGLSPNARPAARAWSHRRSTLPWQPSYQLVSLHNPLAASRSERTEESQQRKKWNAKRIQQNAHEGQFLLGSTDLPISV